MIRAFTIHDYEEVWTLWKRTPGLGLRTMDDSKESITRFIMRNPTTNFIALENDQIVGTVFAGQDGRRGYIYHLCVDVNHRSKSIGSQLINQVIQEMKEEKITKIALVCFTKNELGNQFFRKQGWTLREDLNYYNLSLDDNNQ